MKMTNIQDRILQLTDELKSERYNKHVVITENSNLQLEIDALKAQKRDSASLLA